MGYHIELSLNLRQCSNRTYIKETVIDYAKKNNCEMVFEDIEISGRRSVIHKNISVITILFPEDTKYIIQFIKKIKLIKEISIETIAYDNCIFRVIYSKKKMSNKKNITKDDVAIIQSLK